MVGSRSRSVSKRSSSRQDRENDRSASRRIRLNHSSDESSSEDEGAHRRRSSRSKSSSRNRSDKSRSSTTSSKEGRDRSDRDKEERRSGTGVSRSRSKESGRGRSTERINRDILIVVFPADVTSSNYDSALRGLLRRFRDDFINTDKKWRHKMARRIMDSLRDEYGGDGGVEYHAQISAGKRRRIHTFCDHEHEDRFRLASSPRIRSDDEYLLARWTHAFRQQEAERIGDPMPAYIGPSGRDLVPPIDDNSPTLSAKVSTKKRPNPEPVEMTEEPSSPSSKKQKKDSSKSVSSVMPDLNRSSPAIASSRPRRPASKMMYHESLSERDLYTKKDSAKLTPTTKGGNTANRRSQQGAASKPSSPSSLTGKKIRRGEDNADAKGSEQDAGRERDGKISTEVDGGQGKAGYQKISKSSVEKKATENDHVRPEPQPFWRPYRAPTDLSMLLGHAYAGEARFGEEGADLGAGFNVDVGGSQHSPSWDVMFTLLRRFRLIFGHASVPPAWVGHLPLAIWASQQRQLHRETTRDKYREATAVEKQRLARLNEIGFAWEYTGESLDDEDEDLPPALRSSLWAGPWFELAPTSEVGSVSNDKVSDSANESTAGESDRIGFPSASPSKPGVMTTGDYGGNHANQIRGSGGGSKSIVF